MMYTYIIIDKDDSHEPLSFLKLEDAEAYMEAFQYEWKIIKAKHITHLNAQKYIDWEDIPKHLNFIYRDHAGVWASQYKPISKWYTGNNSQVYRLYGGERLELEYQDYHPLISLGDIFENPLNNKHFINWNKVKGSQFIKFIDNEKQSIDVFSCEGELIVSGSNDDLQIINKNGSFQFEKFPWQTYTYVK